MIAGGGEQLTLRAVARLADACNIGGDLGTVKHKLSVLRRHCEGTQRDYSAIEKTHNNSCSRAARRGASSTVAARRCWLLARDEAAVAAKRQRLAARGPLRGFIGTPAQAIDQIAQYRDAGVQLLINSDYRNDMETHELMEAEVMPHFA
jgi:alkanesulfonate monooxygenase SsuD/methylene tetrahydromethanopterin reductase-like flavin-dependent oxidoreductase (luciferase family)